MDVPFPPRLFSLREANALVASLHPKFARARELRDALQRLQEKLVRANRPIEGPDLQVDPAAPAEVRDLQRAAIERIEELRALLRDVAELGVEVKATDGLVDFRSKLHGRTVYLCWKYGEQEISHYHELHAGFSGRRPLPSEGEFVGDLLQ